MKVFYTLLTQTTNTCFNTVIVKNGSPAIPFFEQLWHYSLKYKICNFFVSFQFIFVQALWLHRHWQQKKTENELIGNSLKNRVWKKMFVGPSFYSFLSLWKNKYSNHLTFSPQDLKKQTFKKLPKKSEWKKLKQKLYINIGSGHNFSHHYRRQLL